MTFTEEGKKYLDKIGDMVKSLHHRGPDGSGVFRHGNVALGHTRLAIIDTSDAAAQPFTSSDGRYTIVFNGEIFNYKELRAELESSGETFRSTSDTEVLLRLRERCVNDWPNRINGFFAFAIYDRETGKVELYRDRYGEKPLYIFHSENFVVFASEIKAVVPFLPEVSINHDSFAGYMHLNYNPFIRTMFKGIDEVPAGMQYTFGKEYEEDIFDYMNYFHAAIFTRKCNDEYPKATVRVRELLDRAVQRRLISDVPIGSFLSGGIDSSVVSAIAARHKSDLETFSIGFADEPYFDETEYAKLVSKHIGSKHHVFSLTNKDLLESLHAFLNQLDEPFADSSALAVNLLARETRKHVTAAISGDGADELFGGYNKHAAEYMVRNPRLRNSFVRAGQLLWSALPASRNSKFGNTIRQLRKYARGLELESYERYWEWAGFTNKEQLHKLIGFNFPSICTEYIQQYFHGIGPNDMNAVLRSDFALVLPHDMLVKVDRMSMLNSLEVRSPFLDHELVEYVMSLPSEYKINRHERKRILKDACRDLLPPEIFTRKKQGFEVPLLKWFRGDLRGMIDELLDEKFLKEQQLFNPEEVKNIRKQLHSNDPGDSAARIWGLIVFQSWYKKFLVH